MAAHDWRRTDRSSDGDAIWECSRCGADAPGFVGGPPMEVTSSEVLALEDCEAQVIRDVHDL